MELGPGCLELTTEHRPIVRAADDAAAAKLYTKAFFARRQQTASFMAQLSEDFPGLGGHPSLSLWDEDGRPALAGDGGLSKLGASAVAGIVQLLPELLAMAAHTVNAYRRYAPGNWAPRSASWGPGNYSCAVRVVTDDPAQGRLELRIPGADTSPHLCSAMLLGAAVWGIEQALDPPEPVVPPVNARDLVDPTIGLLPRSLLEAAERFATSVVAVELFGREFVEHFTASRLAEEAACRRFVPPQERLRYLHQV
jgi:glutamine synthetase